MGEHYFSTDPTGPFERHPLSVSVWGHDLRLSSGSGVFSRGRLDLGTSVLLRHASPSVPGGTYLDLGCGYGVLACALAVADPRAQVWAVDVNERALTLATENAVALGVADRLRVGRPEEVPADVRFDEIWSNPPIRVGKEALHALLLRWLPRLDPEGRALLVVGRNLGSDPLQRWLGDQGWPTARLGSAKGFRVLEVRRPGPG